MKKIIWMCDRCNKVVDSEDDLFHFEITKIDPHNKYTPGGHLVSTKIQTSWCSDCYDEFTNLYFEKGTNEGILITNNQVKMR